MKNRKPERKYERKRFLLCFDVRRNCTIIIHSHIINPRYKLKKTTYSFPCYHRQRQFDIYLKRDYISIPQQFVRVTIEHLITIELLKQNPKRTHTVEKWFLLLSEDKMMIWYASRISFLIWCFFYIYLPNNLFKCFYPYEVLLFLFFIMCLFFSNFIVFIISFILFIIFSVLSRSRAYQLTPCFLSQCHTITYIRMYKILLLLNGNVRFAFSSDVVYFCETYALSSHVI